MKTIRFQKKTLMVSLAIVVVIAASISAKPVNYLALTGGTNGFGFKYSFCFKRVSFDVGAPFLFRLNEVKLRDTIVTTNRFEANTYLSGNVVVYEKEKFQVNLGVMMFNELGLLNIRRNADGTADNDSSYNEFNFDYSFGPVAEYVRRGSEGKRIFSVQLAPVKLSFNEYNRLNFVIGAQLNYYIKQSGV